MNILSTGGGNKFSKKPTDPKYPTTEYTYSLLNTGKEYQIGTVVEDSATAYNNNTHPVFQTPLKRGIFSLLSPLEGLGVDITYAATENITAYIRGNYN